MELTARTLPLTERIFLTPKAAAQLAVVAITKA